MNREEAIKWLKAIEKKYIHGGDEEYDNLRKIALHMAMESLEQSEPCEDTISRRTAIDAFKPLPTIEGLGLQPLITVDDAIKILNGLPSAQPEGLKDKLDDAYAHGYTAAEAKYRKWIEKFDRIIRELAVNCAYDMPSFWCNHGKDYKVIPTKYHKGYMQALADIEERMKGGRRMTVEEMQAKMKYANTSQINPLFKEAAGELKINNSLRIAVYDKLPCRFHRWMARLLLGWQYTENKEKQK